MMDEEVKEELVYYLESIERKLRKYKEEKQEEERRINDANKYLENIKCWIKANEKTKEYVEVLLKESINVEKGSE